MWAFFIDTSPDALTKVLFHLCQAHTSICDLNFPSRSNVRSTFCDDLANLLLRTLEQEKLHRDSRPDVPNAQAYTEDFRIMGQNDSPLFVFGVPNRVEARLKTIMLSHFHRHGLQFDAILVSEDQTQISRMNLAQLSDTVGDMISSPDSHVEFNRKLLQRVARAWPGTTQETLLGLQAHLPAMAHFRCAVNSPRLSCPGAWRLGMTVLERRLICQKATVAGQTSQRNAVSSKLRSFLECRNSSGISRRDSRARMPIRRCSDTCC